MPFVIFNIDRALSGATTPGQNGPGSNGNEGVLRIPQSFSIAGISPSDCLVSYPRHSLGRVFLLLCRETVGVFYSPSWLGKRETGSLQIAIENNVIKTNYEKRKVDPAQQNNKCRLSDDRDKMINPIINDCIELAQKDYKTRHDWVRKVIHWKLCKKLKFHHASK